MKSLSKKTSYLESWSFKHWSEGFTMLSFCLTLVLICGSVIYGIEYTVHHRISGVVEKVETSNQIDGGFSYIISFEDGRKIHVRDVPPETLEPGQKYEIGVSGNKRILTMRRMVK